MVKIADSFSSSTTTNALRHQSSARSLDWFLHRTRFSFSSTSRPTVFLTSGSRDDTHTWAERRLAVPLQLLCRLPTHRVAAAGALTFQCWNDRPYCASAHLNHLSILWPDRWNGKLRTVGTTPHEASTKIFQKRAQSALLSVHDPQPKDGCGTELKTGKRNEQHGERKWLRTPQD